MSSLPAGTGWAVAAVAGVAATVFLLSYAVLDAAFGRTPMQRRLRALRKFTVSTSQEKKSTIRALRTSLGRAVEGSPLLVRLAARSEHRLEQAGAATRPADWLGLRLVAAGAGAVVLTFVLPWAAGVPLGLVLGFALPAMVLRFRIKRRKNTFADELPAMLQLVLSSLRSGFTLQQSIEAGVHDDTGPVAEELTRALSESRINGEFEDALNRVGERIGSDDMLWLVMAIRLQREVGGSLAEVMQTTADTMRERAYLRRQVRTLSAEGRFSAYILAALPICVSAMLFITRPEYVRPLITQPLGFAMLAAAVVLMGVGGLWLRTSVKIEI